MLELAFHDMCNKYAAHSPTHQFAAVIRTLFLLLSPHFAPICHITTTSPQAQAVAIFWAVFLCDLRRCRHLRRDSIKMPLVRCASRWHNFSLRSALSSNLDRFCSISRDASFCARSLFITRSSLSVYHARVAFWICHGWFSLNDLRRAAWGETWWRFSSP